MNGVCLINITRTDCFFQTIDTCFFLDYMTKLTATVTFKKEQIHTNTQKGLKSLMATLKSSIIFYFRLQTSTHPRELKREIRKTENTRVLNNKRSIAKAHENHYFHGQKASGSHL